MAVHDDAGAIRLLEQAILDAASRWTAADWARDSYCPGWTFAGVIAHLIQVGELAELGLRRGMQGDGGPPPEATDLLQWRAARQARNRELATGPTAALLAQFRATIESVNTALADAANHPPTTPAWHPAGTQTLAWWRPQWLFEIGIHDWDLRVANDPAAEIRTDVLEPLLQSLLDRLPRWIDSARLAGVDGRVGLTIRTPEPVLAEVELRDGRATVRRGTTPGADAQISADASTFILVGTYRQPAATAIAAGRWRGSGNAALAEAFAGGFRAV